ncbi:MAG: hypothetical protein H0Z39_10395 [Peptococcaceae bacterium]|nr:hypothetical protein [Peptococcaceae bacterium]
MVFQVYHPEQEPNLFRRKQPVVALTKTSIRLNKAAFDKINDEYQYLELAYDDQTQTIRLRKANKGFPVENRKINCKGFFKHFGIDVQGKFLARYDDQEKAFYINIG